MELLISCWSIKNHTFIAACGECGPTFEDVVALTCLLMFGEVKAIKIPRDYEEIVLEDTDKMKLEALNKSLSESKSSNKRTYASWVRHFDIWMEMAWKLSSRRC